MQILWHAAKRFRDYLYVGGLAFESNSVTDNRRWEVGNGGSVSRTVISNQDEHIRKKEEAREVKGGRWKGGEVEGGKEV